MEPPAGTVTIAGTDKNAELELSCTTVLKVTGEFRVTVQEVLAAEAKPLAAHLTVLTTGKMTEIDAPVLETAAIFPAAVAPTDFANATAPLIAFVASVALTVAI